MAEAEGSTRAIVLFLSAADIAPVLPLRKRFDPLAETVPSHITLVFPFADALTAEGLRTHVEEAVRGLGPIPVRLAGITGSEGEYLFLSVKGGNDALIDLHDRLYTGPLRRHRSLAHTYLPHVTVGRFAGRAAFERALEVASATSLCIETVCATVSICRIRLDGTTGVESEVSFAGP